MYALLSPFLALRGQLRRRSEVAWKKDAEQEKTADDLVRSFMSTLLPVAASAAVAAVWLSSLWAGLAHRGLTLSPLGAPRTHPREHAARGTPQALADEAGLCRRGEPCRNLLPCSRSNARTQGEPDCTCTKVR